MASLRPVELAEHERRYVVLPGDARTFTNVTVPLAAPTADVPLDGAERDDLRSCLEGAREVYLDAVAGRWIDGGGARWVRVLPVEDGNIGVPGSTAPVDPQPADTIVGQRFNGKLLRAALDALPRGPLAIVWRGSMDVLTLHALEAPAGYRDAMVMPMRSCSPPGFWPKQEAEHRAVCRCRDCAAWRKGRA